MGEWAENSGVGAFICYLIFLWLNFFMTVFVLFLKRTDTQVRKTSYLWMARKNVNFERCPSRVEGGGKSGEGKVGGRGEVSRRPTLPLLHGSWLSPCGQTKQLSCSIP